MNLIIIAGLAEPPTESIPFRNVTSIAKESLNLDVLVETEQEMKDQYFEYMLHKGFLDYVEQLVTPKENIEGIRLDTEFNYPRTIPVKAITFLNFLNIIGQIKFISNI